MGDNKKSSSRFTKGDPRASAAGKKSRGYLPKEVNEARKYNAVEFEQSLYKYMNMPRIGLQRVFDDPATPSRDMAVIRILLKSIVEGDHRCLDFLLDRTIGKVKDNIHLTGEVKVKSITEMLEESETKKLIDVTPKKVKND